MENTGMGAERYAEGDSKGEVGWDWQEATNHVEDIE